MFLPQSGGKYEVQAGSWRTTEELVQVYHELIGKNHPVVSLVVNPLHRMDCASDQGDFVSSILHNKSV